ncbi:MAG: O-antigen ligase family protein [Calothrix sp. FI2-JRJ7]|nr:O-antigen ligase family protein [Calothrix sp. FI2-JRJ7]
MSNQGRQQNLNIDKLHLGDLSTAEKVIYWTIVLTPLWWLLGIQTVLYPTVAFILLVMGFELDKITKSSLPFCNWAWLGMTVAALWTNILGLDSVGFDVMKTLATIFTLFKGYFMIFACMTLPFWHRIRVQVITRAVAWMAVGLLVTLIIQLLILAAIGPLPHFMPPLAKLIPGEKLSLMVKFAVFQPFFRIPLPRADLYTADPPILGVCALVYFFICLGESNRRLRKYALSGCVACLIISQSRLAWVCFPLTILIINSFRSRFARIGSLWITSFISFVCAILGWTISDVLSQPLSTFNSARADSSKDREFIISATIDAWRESPWVGWGIIEKTATWGNGAFELPLGTFSSYSQVLYLHGIFGFVFFAAALISTLGIFWQPAVQGNKVCQRAFATLIALYTLCQATTLTWMGIYFWFLFIWLGAIIAETQNQNVSNWNYL